MNTDEPGFIIPAPVGSLTRTIPTYALHAKLRTPRTTIKSMEQTYKDYLESQLSAWWPDDDFDDDFEAYEQQLKDALAALRESNPELFL